MVELNASNEVLERVLEVLPCMREPTLAPLRGGEATSVKAAVPKQELVRLIPELKAAEGQRYCCDAHQPDCRLGDGYAYRTPLPNPAFTTPAYRVPRHPLRSICAWMETRVGEYPSLFCPLSGN